MKVNRPVLRYHGGKWRIASWIISYFPDHKIYVEPYGGAASCLMKKEKSFAEVYNDMDDEIVNVFQVLRNPELSTKLLYLIDHTPFSRSEFINSYKPADSLVERARKTIVRSFMGYSSDGVTRGSITGFRGNNFKSGRYSAGDWSNYPRAISKFIERIKTVCIENIDGIQCILKYDSENTLFYVDPPYVLSTRHKGLKTKSYKFEMSDYEHANLLMRLNAVKGKVIISGFDNGIYNKYLKNWNTAEKETYGQSAKGGSKKNLEKIWFNFTPAPQRGKTISG